MEILDETRSFWQKSKFDRKPKFFANTEFWSKIENLASVFLLFEVRKFSFFYDQIEN